MWPPSRERGEDFFDLETAGSMGAILKRKREEPSGVLRVSLPVALVLIIVYSRVCRRRPYV